MARKGSTGKSGNGEATGKAPVLEFPKPAPVSTSPSAVPSTPDSPLIPSPKPSRADIDRLGYVYSVLADYKVLVAPFEKEKGVLENTVNAAVANVAADDIFTGEGDAYRLKVGEQAEQQQLVEGGLKQVLEFVGQDKFLAMCGVTLKELERALSAEQYALVVVKSRTGKRTITVVPKAAPTPLKPAA